MNDVIKPKSIKKDVQIPRPGSQKGTLKELAGSDSDDFNRQLANSLLQTLWFGPGSDNELDRDMQAAMAALVGIAPKDEVEGMLAAQMIACHHATMECYRRAMLPNQTHEGRQQSLNFAAKLSRTFALHTETLDKHRGKGQQTVRVEHVTVNAGGQAIVGHVEHKPGGGSPEKQEE